MYELSEREGKSWRVGERKKERSYHFGSFEMSFSKKNQKDSKKSGQRETSIQTLNFSQSSPFFFVVVQTVCVMR